MPRKDQWWYDYEYTDTFAGEANYCWVRRGTVKATTLYGALRVARAEAGLTGERGDISGSFGDSVHWVPRGTATVLMIQERMEPPENEESGD